MKILISGAAGLLGKALIERLSTEGHYLILLTRHPKTSQNPLIEWRVWDGKSIPPFESAGAPVEALINLAGEPIAAKRWTPAQKEKILSSRVDATKSFVTWIEKSPVKPKVLINASGAGYYGIAPGRPVTEADPAGKDFLGETCIQWEAEAIRASRLGVRTVLCRFGVILDKNQGALTKFLPPFQFFIGGPLGSGKQPFPWIHVRDAAGIICFAIKNAGLEGPVNVTAPEQVTMNQFCKTFGKILHRPSFMKVPAFILRIMLGEMAEMILGGQHAIPAKLKAIGYAFEFPTLELALRNLFNKRRDS